MHFSNSVSSEDKLLLYSLYNEPGRYYHNLNHIKFMISKLHEFSSNKGFLEESVPSQQLIADSFEEVLTAIWWHDSVYNFWMGSPYNEVESAKLFRDSAPPLSDESTSSIGLAIEATAFHPKDQSRLNLTSRLLLDLDLAAFALPFPLVERNTIDVLREARFANSEWSDIIVKQRMFLESLYDKDKIFYTNYFNKNYEKKARQTIEYQFTVNNYLERLIPHVEQ